jgi:sugar transferase (PEP-CTERM system associated)
MDEMAAKSKHKKGAPSGSKSRPAQDTRSPADLYVLPLPAAAHARRRIPLRLRHGHVQLLGRDISTPMVLLALAEFLVLMAAFHLAVQIRLPEGAALVGVFGEPVWTLVAFAAVNFAALLSMGFYRKGACEQTAAMLLRLVGGLVLAAGALAVLFFLLPEVSLGRGALAMAFAFAFAGLLLTRLIGVRLLEMEVFRRRVLVLGSGANANVLNQLRRRADRQAFDLVGFLPGPNETRVVEETRLITSDLPLAQYAVLSHVDDVVIALDDARGGFPFDELIACKMSGIDVLDIADFFEREAGAVKLDTLRPSTIIFSRGFRQSLYRDFAKRALDILASLGLLAVAWPFMLLTAAGVLLESRGRGSILYRQVRVGQHGRHFTLLKFRSMVMDAESDGVARWAQQNDERITGFGRFIRKTRLDELPQLLNVLRGDMSFVGPRPERPVFVRQLAQRLPFYQHRHWVKPGLTGWAQINYPYGASERDAYEKLQYDLYYVKNPSITLDLLTIAQTVEVVLFGRGSR